MITADIAILVVSTEPASKGETERAGSPIVRSLMRAGRLDLFEAAMDYRILKYRWANLARSRWRHPASLSDPGKALLREIIEIDTMLCRHGGLDCFAALQDLIVLKRDVSPKTDASIVSGLTCLAAHFGTHRFDSTAQHSRDGKQNSRRSSSSSKRTHVRSIEQLWLA